MTALSIETAAAETATYCPQHPQVETRMRCNKCGKLICLKCAARTPVGYRCRDCVYQQQNIYFNAKGYENMIAFLVSFGLTCLATPLVALISDSFYFGAFYLAFLAGPSAGALLVQSVRLAVQRRRSRHMHFFLVGGMIVGLLVAALGLFVVMDMVLLVDLPVLIFAFLAVTTGYQLLK